MRVWTAAVLLGALARPGSAQDARDLGTVSPQDQLEAETGQNLGPSTVLSARPEHVACVLPGAHPRIAADLVPASQVQRARVFFRAQGTRDFYAVDMEKAAGDRFWGVLPRPESTTPAIEYYVEGLDLQGRHARSARTRAAVGSCADPAVTQASGALWVEGPPGATAAPPGFSAHGLTVVGQAKIGVFRMSQGLALGASLALGAGAYALLHNQSENAPPPPPPAQFLPYISITGANPPLGSTVRPGTVVSLSLRAILAADLSAGRTRVELYRGNDPTVCAVVEGDHPAWPRGNSLIPLAVTGPAVVGACGSSFSVTRGRVFILDGSGAVFLQTGGDLADLNVPYTFEG